MTVNTLRPRPLTPIQKKILDKMVAHYRKHGYAPSLSELARQEGKAVSTVHEMVEAIRKKGHIKKLPNLARGFTSLSHQTSIQIPLLGKIAAGPPIEPFENPEPIDVPDYMIKGDIKDYYALEVKGDSMIEDDVWDSDIILIKYRKVPQQNEMIVAVVDGEVTLKIYGGVNHLGQVVLQPRNKKLNNIYVDPKYFEVRGIFAGLIRRHL